MSNFVISLLVAAGTGVWIFNKLQNKTGNNTQKSLTASGVSAVIIFIVLLSVLHTIIK